MQDDRDLVPGEGEGEARAARPRPAPAPERDAGPATGATVSRESWLRRRAIDARREGTTPAERSLLLSADAQAPGQARDASELDGLRQVLKLSRELSGILDPEKLCGAILDAAIDITGSERGLLLLQEGEHRLRVVVGRDQGGASIDPETARISETLARECLRQNRLLPYSSLDDLAEMADLGTARSLHELRILWALCVPLRERGAAVGVLYLDSRARTLRSDAAAQEMLEAFASHAAVALANARLHRREEETRLLLERENEGLRDTVRRSSGFARMVGVSPVMQALYTKVRLIKDSDIPVLICGETGTGKELVARALHYEGLRQEGPFVPVNCAAIPAALLESQMFGYARGSFTGAVKDTPGLVEEAHRGTLFLDEIGDLSLELQAKLLRFLETGEFRRVGETEGMRRTDVRIVSATLRSLPEMIGRREFREDLFYRLAGVRVDLPALRERGDDLGLLIDHFFVEAVRAARRPIQGITPRARSILLRQSWPGNVRQLRSVIFGAAALVPAGESLDAAQVREQLPEIADDRLGLHAPEGTSLDEATTRYVRELLAGVLDRREWNITRAAAELSISRQHLHNLIKQHGLERPGRSGAINNKRS